MPARREGDPASLIGDIGFQGCQLRIVWFKGGPWQWLILQFAPNGQGWNDSGRDLENPVLCTIAVSGKVNEIGDGSSRFMKKSVLLPIS